MLPPSPRRAAPLSPPRPAARLFLLRRAAERLRSYRSQLLQSCRSHLPPPYLARLLHSCRAYLLHSCRAYLLHSCRAYLLHSCRAYLLHSRHSPWPLVTRGCLWLCALSGSASAGAAGDPLASLPLSADPWLGPIGPSALYAADEPVGGRRGLWLGVSAGVSRGAGERERIFGLLELGIGLDTALAPDGSAALAAPSTGSADLEAEADADPSLADPSAPERRWPPRRTLPTDAPIVSNPPPRARSPRELSPRELSPRELAPRDPTPRELTPRELTPHDPAAPRNLAPRNLAPRNLAPRDLAPRDPTPRELTPRELTPHDPAAPRNLAPRDPTPRDPTPRELTPRELTPHDPTPRDPTPRELASRDPAPEDPARRALPARNPAIYDPTAREPSPPVGGGCELSRSCDPTAVAALARAVVAAALRVQGGGLELRRLEGMAARSRAAAALPEVRLGAGTSRDESLRLSPTLADPARFTRDGGRDLWLEARLTWRLDGALFARDEIAIMRLRAQQREEATRLTRGVLEALIALERARLLLASETAPPEEREAAIVRQFGAVAELDVLTDGWFSRRRARARGNGAPGTWP